MDQAHKYVLRRLAEERETLLRTGIYLVIRQLDQRFR
jgi:hypothetical protein